MEQPTRPWRIEDIDKLLELLPIMESPDFVAATWPQEVDTADLQMPYPTYHPVVDQMRTLLFSTSAYIDPYAPLPEDPTQEGVPFNVMGVDYPLAYFETATVDQLRRYLVRCYRSERFCDGYIDSQFKSGSIQSALRRLRELRANMR
jgi:hypothetical protein